MPKNPDELPQNEAKDGAVKQENILNLQENWDRTRENLENIADKLGYPIDEGVKEAITSFAVNGYPTWGSCEGHLEKRFGKMIKLSPYVAVGETEPDVRFIGESDIKEKIAAEFGVSAEGLAENEDADKKYWNYIHEHQVQETPEFLATREGNENMQRNIGALLDEFYKDRTTEGRKVTIRRIGPAGQFYVTTAARSEDTGNKVEKEDLGKAKQELSQEQAEFAAFTEFLKKRYFGEDSEKSAEEISAAEEKFEKVKSASEQEDAEELAEARTELGLPPKQDEHEHSHASETQEERDESAEKILGRVKNASPEIKEMAETFAGQVREIGSRATEDMRKDLEDMILGHTDDLNSYLSPEDAQELYQILYGEKFEGEATMSSRIPGNKGYEAEKAKQDERIRLETERRNQAEQGAIRRGQENVRRMGEEARKREEEWLKQRAEKRAEEERLAEEKRKSRWFGLGRFFK